MMHTKHLVVIDDDEMIHKVFNLITTLHSYRVSSICTSKKAMEYAANPSLLDKPDIIVVDYMLGDIKGTDVIKKMRDLSYFDDIPVIIYTGYFGSICDVLLKELRVDECLQKPSSNTDLLECINRHSGRGAINRGDI